MGDRVWLSVVLTSGLLFGGKGQSSLVGVTLGEFQAPFEKSVLKLNQIRGVPRKRLSAFAAYKFKVIIEGSMFWDGIFCYLHSYSSLGSRQTVSSSTIWFPGPDSTYQLTPVSHRELIVVSLDLPVCSFQVCFMAGGTPEVAPWERICLSMQETQEMGVRSLGQEDPLEQEMATCCSILAWKSHGQRSLAGYSPWVCKESDTTEHDCTCFFCTIDSLHTQNLAYSECSNIVQVG